MWQRRKGSSYEELSLITNEKQALNDEEAGGPTGLPPAPAPSDGLVPKPLPAPSVLDRVGPPPLRPEYSRYELRRCEDDHSESARHCWAAIPPRQFAVRAAGYLRDGARAPSETGSELLAVELFRTGGAPQLHVAARPDAPTKSLRLSTALLA